MTDIENSERNVPLISLNPNSTTDTSTNSKMDDNSPTQSNSNSTANSTIDTSTNSKMDDNSPRQSSSNSTANSSDISHEYAITRSRKDDLSNLINNLDDLLNIDKFDTFTLDELTIITGLFDLTFRQNKVYRDIEQYLILGEHILNLPVNMFIITEPHLACRVWKYRMNLGLLHKTFIYTCRLENSPYYRHYNEIVNAFNNGGQPELYGGTKFTPLYLLIGWTRFYAIKEALTINPFNNDGFVWIDYGITHLYEDKQYAYDAILNTLNNYRKDKIKILLLEHTAPDEISNLTNYYKRIKYKVATGMFGGPANLIKWLIDNFDKNLIQCLHSGYPSLEEAIINITCTNYPQFFDFYYGDYPSVCTNSPFYRKTFYQIKFALLQCRDRMWMNGVKICRYMVKSIQYDQSYLTVMEEIQIMDELLLSVWNAFGVHVHCNNELKFKICKLAGERIVHLFTIFPELLTSEIRPHYANNIGFLGLKLPS